MTITLLNKTKTRLRVKETLFPVSDTVTLGIGVDATKLPEGHASCPRCKGYKWECWMLLDSHRLELGCVGCGESFRLVFPLDVKLPGEQGRFSCKRHPNSGMVLIHNVDVISIGCEKCVTEVQIYLHTKSNLVMAD